MDVEWLGLSALVGRSCGAIMQGQTWFCMHTKGKIDGRLVPTVGHGMRATSHWHIVRVVHLRPEDRNGSKRFHLRLFVVLITIGWCQNVFETNIMKIRVRVLLNISTIGVGESSREKAVGIDCTDNWG